MLGKSLLILSAVALAAVPRLAEARSDAVVGGSQARSDLNTHADDYGYHPGRRSFYSYPRHRHIDGGGDDRGSFGPPLHDSHDGSPSYDGNYGSPYYGTNYGAPYYGGGYYDGGVYYRERRD
jgi:hypothetical protein